MQTETNEEMILLQGVAKLLEDNLPEYYARPVPTSFEENRIDALDNATKLCMVDIGNTGAYDPMPDMLNTVSGGISIKPVVLKLYIFGMVMDIKNVNIGTDQDPGILKLEREVFSVINKTPYLGMEEYILRWRVRSVDRDPWKKIDYLIGSTVELEVEMGERDRINP